MQSTDINNNRTNYLVAVLPDRLQAEAAYTSLENAKLPVEQLDILGQGYKSADEYGLINPDQAADKQIKQLATWVIPFGFGAGYLFNLLTGIEIVGWLGNIGNHILGGIFGAAAAAFGAYATGKLSGWTVGSGDAIAYRNRLNAGKYLIIAKGKDAFVETATQLLRQYDLENIQGYVEQASS